MILNQVLNSKNSVVLITLLALSFLVQSIVMLRYAGQPTTFKAFSVKDNYYHSAEGVISLKRVSGDVQLNTLDLPVKSVDDVASWAAQVAVSLFTVDFHSYNQQYIKLQEYFTPSAWGELQETVLSSGWLEAVINKKLTATAVLLHPPVVAKRGENKGVYTWLMTFPVLITYESASQVVREKRIVTVRVKRVPANFETGQVGIAIDSIETAVSK